MTGAGEGPELVAVGWITIDDIVLPDGSYHQEVLGGGALYAAVGARIWNERVGLHSVAGAERIDEVVARIEAAGIDARGVNAIPGPGLELWLLHENDHDKQQVPTLASASAEAMDRGRAPLPAAYAGVRGVHVAPQTPEGAFGNLAALRRRPEPPLLTLDLLVDAYVDASRYRELAFLGDLAAFLPSREEVRHLWDPPSLEAWARERATTSGSVVAIKLGSEGSLVAGGGGEVLRVPAYPAEAVDTTGAGDAYCGGFLAGLVAARPLAECAAMATVAASYVVEARGALKTYRPAETERTARLERVLEGVRDRD